MNQDYNELNNNNHGKAKKSTKKIILICIISIFAFIVALICSIKLLYPTAMEVRDDKRDTYIYKVYDLSDKLIYLTKFYYKYNKNNIIFTNMVDNYDETKEAIIRKEVIDNFDFSYYVLNDKDHVTNIKGYDNIDYLIKELGKCDYYVRIVTNILRYGEMNVDYKPEISCDGKYSFTTFGYDMYLKN